MEIKDEIERSICLDKTTYYDSFSKKVRYINRYDDVVRLFVGNRILPILCNELNHEKFSDYRELPVPALKGSSILYLANDELILTPDTYHNYDVTNLRWPYLVLCVKDVSMYRVVARSNYVINYNGEYELHFLNSHKTQYQSEIKQFKNKCIQLASQILEKFIQTPLLQAIKRYDSVKEFAGLFATNIDRKLYKKGLKNYRTYLESTSNKIELRLERFTGNQNLYNNCENDDCFNLFDYDYSVTNTNKLHNLFYSNYLVTRNQWIEPVSYDQNKATPEEVKASKIFFNIMKKEFPGLNIQ